VHVLFVGLFFFGFNVSLIHSIQAPPTGVGKNMLLMPSAVYMGHAFRYMRTLISYMFPVLLHQVN